MAFKKSDPAQETTIAADPAVVGAADENAEVLNGEAVDADTVTFMPATPAHAADDHAYTTGDGNRVTRAFSPKFLLPDPGYIMREVVAPSSVPGAVKVHKMIGRLSGIVTRYEHRSNKATVNGVEKTIQSIGLVGVMQSENLDGEVSTVSIAFLPMAFAEQVSAAIDMGATAVQLDIDIGVIATGKPIPYEWTVTSYLEGRAERAIRQIRNSRKIGQAPQLTGQQLRLN